MADDTTQGTEPSGDGQPEGAPDTTASAPDAGTMDGQPAGASDGATDTGHQADDVIFDPQEYKKLTESLTPELQAQAEALRKSLIGSYTKKTQSIAEQKKKIEAYDAFNSNPAAALEQMAKQYGYELKKPGGDTSKASEGWNPEAGDPQNWNEVVSYITDTIKNSFGGQLQPIVQEFQSMRKQSIEHQLSEIDPAWQQYEDSMAGVLKEHPTLAKDPAMLYRMSVPAEVAESRATQRAIKRMEAKTKSSQVGSPSTTNKKPAGGLPDGKLTFAAAVAAAKAKIADEGLSPP